MSATVESLYDILTVREIMNQISACPPAYRPTFPVSGRLQRNKPLLIQKLLEVDPFWKRTLGHISADKQAAKLAARQARRSRDAGRQRAHRAESHEQGRLTEFLDLPSQDDTGRCHREFYESTTNDALRKLVCAVCARSLNAQAASFSLLPLDDLPNRHRLQPTIPHDAHVFTDGCLLDREGCTEDNNKWTINICNGCLAELQKERDCPPKHSLANGLWVGPVPWELQVLTLAEQLLIARAYPRVFVVKLFPKDNSRHGLRDDQLQSAMRGNVTSFELNTDAISNMIDGNLMPQPPAILASVLSVTFVGRGNVPNPAALRLFHVRRDRVRDALIWLKRNNPKYYGEIDICESRLAPLPTDGVPAEIQVNIQHESDPSALDAESDGYIPSGDSREDPKPQPTHMFADNGDTGESQSNPDVVPLQYLGVMDNDLTQLSAQELMQWGLQNLCPQNEESGYAIRYGRPVNTFGRPPQGTPASHPALSNYWERAFPILYPYGVGGIEGDQKTKLSFIEHARWSLCYHDRRYRLHPSFVFVACSIYQRRQALSSARVQMQRRDFDSMAETLDTITPEDLKRAAEEEACGRQPSNPAIHVLKRLINATSSRVFGSDAARFQYRSQIWSTSMYLNPPTLWITINPDDLHDPIAQILAGEDIDMDHFSQTAGPDKLRRSQNIASDSFAAAEFFHFLITTILEKLFSIKSTPSRTYSQPGVLGRVQAYFGTVECQGRGTLHLHMLLWLHAAPSPETLREKLQSHKFRAKVLAYIRSNIRSFTPGLSTQAQVAATPTEPEVAYSRFPDPSLPPDQFKAAVEDLETRVVRTKQIHVCVFGKCLRSNKHGQLVCKRRAPWDLSETDVVETDGTYQTKRSLGFLNNYCPAIVLAAKCNNDIKILLHGTGTNNITFYITGYIAKKQGKSHNASSLLAEGLLYHFQDNTYFDDLRERQRMLIFRAVNVLNREQEMPAPLAVSYLMGWGDVYHSHNYATIYWGAFISLINSTFPELKRNVTHTSPPSAEPTNSSLANVPPCVPEQGNSGTLYDGDCNEPEVILQFNKHGRLRHRSQVDDYMHRGDEAASYSMLDYFIGTYEISHKQKDGKNATTDSLAEDHGERKDTDSGNSKRGRPKHQRINYQPTHPRHDSHIRVIRPQGHNTLPNLVGPHFPRRSDPDQSNFYAASVLTLLKPWRSLYDLKQPLQPWKNALDDFVSTAGKHTRDIIDSLEHYHTCRSAAEKDQHILPELVEESLDYEDSYMHYDTLVAGPQTLTNSDVTPEMILKARKEAENARESTHGVQAVEIGRTMGVFNATKVPTIHTASRATIEDVETLKQWQDQLKKVLVHVDDQFIPGDTTNYDAGGVTTLDDIPSHQAESDVDILPSPLQEQPIGSVNPDQLFPEQRRAFDIVRWHMNQTLTSVGQSGANKPPQLLMMLVGEGGTGKSKVIQTITGEFEQRRSTHMLLKSAYTGIAASLIDGKTTHNIGCISVNGTALSDKAKNKLAKTWKDVKYLILDECSMLSKRFFGQLSCHITIAKMQSDSDPSVKTSPFGGVNVLLCGDFHQFPPVAASPSSALYHETRIGREPPDSDAAIGRKIIKQFKNVVVLRRQVRATDPVWREFLSALRHGRIQDHHIQMLYSLVLTSPRCVHTDFKSDTWSNCSLVTPRHAVRMRWNHASVARHCENSGSQLFLCPARDSIRNRSLTMVEKYVAAASGSGRGGSRKGRGEKNGLPDEVPLAIGMKVMVTLNVETDIDVANGARGTIVGIVLDPDEPPFDKDGSTVTLTRLPLYILVKMDRTRAIRLPGLDDGVLPIVPASKNYQIVVAVRQENGEVAHVRRTVRRLQYPITPAYAFTDYRSQGQTISAAIVDIATPPTGGGLSLFNIYVALSRSSGRDTIRILRDFDKRLLSQPLDSELVKMDEDLDRMDSETSKWWERMKETHCIS